jgi:hypothetical protein
MYLTSRSLAAASNSGNSSASCAQVLTSQAPIQNSTELIPPTVLAITSQHRPHKKHGSSIVVFTSVAAGMCLLSHSPEMGCVTPFIKNLLSQETGVIL